MAFALLPPFEAVRNVLSARLARSRRTLASGRDLHRSGAHRLELRAPSTRRAAAHVQQHRQGTRRGVCHPERRAPRAGHSHVRGAGGELAATGVLSRPRLARRGGGALRAQDQRGGGRDQSGHARRCDSTLAQLHALRHQLPEGVEIWLGGPALADVDASKLPARSICMTRARGIRAARRALGGRALDVARSNPAADRRAGLGGARGLECAEAAAARNSRGIAHDTPCRVPGGGRVRLDRRRLDRPAKSRPASSPPSIARAS